MGKVSDALSWYQNREPDRMALNFFFLTSVVIFIVYRKGVKRIKDTPSLPPGPRGLPVLGYLPFLLPDLHRCFADLAQTFGPLMTMWIGSRQCIIVSSSEAAREVCRDHDATFANHDTTAAARIISFGAQDMVFQPYSPKWRTLRKECVRELLNTKILDSFHALRQREVRSMVEELYRRTGEVVDVGQVAFVTVLNVVTAMLWGNSLPAEERERVGDEFRELVDGILHLIGVTNMSDIFPVLEWMDLQGVQRKMKEHKERLDRLLSMIIEQRKGTLEASGDQEKMKDFLQVMLEMVKEDPHQLLPKLTYLGSVIKEVLRLHPALPLLVPHCPSSTCTINGYTIPQGSQVFVNVWAIHRDPAIWENPLEFKPERFLGIDGSKWDFTGNDFRYFPFGSGRRICAGIPMAERIVGYALASLLHSFDWNLPEGTKLDLSERFGIVLKKATPLVAVPTPKLSREVLAS